MSITFLPIGTIHSPFQDIEGMPIQPSGAKEVKGKAVVEPAHAGGLEDIDGFSHIILIYHFHASRGYSLSVKPFMDDRMRGVFATRAPRRPNPIGLSVVRLLSRENNVLRLQGVDVLDGTPLLDIKPYVPKFDAADEVAIGWLEGNAEKSETLSSDGRFRE